MTDTAALQKLLTFLSPAFPVGAFAWSTGLETAIAERAVTDSTAVENWLRGSLAHGGLRTDGILLAQAFRGFEDTARLAKIADLALALTPAVERHAETLATGDAFVVAMQAWPSEVYSRLPLPCPYPVAVGAVAAAHNIALEDTLIAFLTSAVQTQISVAVRLVPIGQTAGLQALAALESQIRDLAATTATASLDDIGGIAYAADIAQMRHETLGTRIFRS
jgi:urease accessory protein